MHKLYSQKHPEGESPSYILFLYIKAVVFKPWSTCGIFKQVCPGPTPGNPTISVMVEPIELYFYQVPLVIWMCPKVYTVYHLGVMSFLPHSVGQFKTTNYFYIRLDYFISYIILSIQKLHVEAITIIIILWLKGLRLREFQ